MKSPEHERRAGEHGLHGAADRVRAEAELGVHRAGLEVGVGLGGHPWAHPEQDALAHARRIRAVGEPADLLDVVDDHAANPQAYRHLELVVGLVVPVERDPLRSEARDRSGVKLAARDDVERETFLGHDPQEPRRAVRLRRIADRRSSRIATERVTKRAGARADRGLVVYVQRRAV